MTQMNLALFRGLLDPRIFGCIRVLYMTETTAEIWIRKSASPPGWGLESGENPSYLLLLGENHRSFWMLMSFDLHISKPPVVSRPKRWVPSFKHPIEDAMLLFAVMGAKVPEVRTALGEVDKSRNRNYLDVDGLFPKGFPRQVYAANQKYLKNWHVVVSLSNGSHAKLDVDALSKYEGLDIEVRETTSFHRREIYE